MDNAMMLAKDGFRDAIEQSQGRESDQQLFERLQAMTNAMPPEMRAEALCVATLHGQDHPAAMRIARLLLEEGVPPDSPSRLGEGPVYGPGDTPLIIAAFQWLHMKRHVLETFAPLVDSERYDAFMLRSGGCTWADQYSFLEELVQHYGADPERLGSTLPGLDVQWQGGDNQPSEADCALGIAKKHGFHEVETSTARLSAAERLSC